MKRKLRIILLLMLLASFLTYRLTYSNLEPHFVCYATSDNCGNSKDGMYVDISSTETLNSRIKRDPIVFLESMSHATLTPRMLCAIESAARAHREKNIYVLMTSSIVMQTPILKAILESYGNINLVYFQVEELFRGSPLQSIYEKKMWLSSRWPNFHLNDILRWLILWKFGGIYLDLDSLVVRSLNPLANFSGLESDEWVGAGVLGFSTKHHPLMSQVLDRILNRFDVSEWGTVGPKLLTRVLMDKCGLSPPSAESPHCPDVKIMEKKAFYPIPWWKWKVYFEENQTLTKELFEDTNIYVFHVWNYLSHTVPLNLFQESPYAMAVHKFCPTVGNEVGAQM